MQNRKLHVVVSALLVAALLTTSISAAAFAAVDNTPSAAAAQTVASTVSGTLPGGEFAKTWLGFSPTTPNSDVTITITWDIDAPGNNGRHFYVLDENNLANVVNGGALQDNNIASSSPVFQGPGNQENAVFRAGTGTYTVVVANDSNSDGTYTLTSAGGTFRDDSNQVADPNATPGDETPAADTAAEVAAEATPDATAEASTVVTETTVVTTTTATTETTVAAAVTPEAVTTTTTTTAELRATEMEGALAEQYDQHFLGLLPDNRDGEISLLLTFDPQDSQELARRLNFWVLDANGLQRFVEGTNASEVAIAAGNRTFTGDTNERVATFSAAGTGPYTVIVYNNSQVPATYKIVVTGGMLVDDSAQTTTAQNAAPVTATGTTTTTTTAAATTAATTAAATTTTAGANATTDPAAGSTHTVVSGDTLAIIARDTYGDYTLYTALCAYNNISDCNRIEVGQVIQTPPLAELSSGATASATTAAAAPAATPAVTAAAATAAATPAASEEMTDTTTSGATTGTAASATPAATATKAASLPTATTAASTGSTASGDNIIAKLKANGNFTILLRALDAAGLTSQLEGAGTFTLFAPTDTAFTDLGLADVNSLIRDTALVENLLLYHMADSKVSTAAVSTGESLTTLQGSAVEFTKAGQTVKVQDSNIIVPDLAAANGVIQIIDKVMLPPQ